ncbi:hypothetical protein [Roseibium sp.]|uniref:hypothetical protein n=1 Tax=Roseibium sp. TaxID=1936156 RepID=UPI003A972193
MNCILAAAAIVMTALAGKHRQRLFRRVFRHLQSEPQGDNFLALRTCGSSKCRMTHSSGLHIHGVT